MPTIPNEPLGRSGPAAINSIAFQTSVNIGTPAASVARTFREPWREFLKTKFAKTRNAYLPITANFAFVFSSVLQRRGTAQDGQAHATNACRLLSPRCRELSLVDPHWRRCAWHRQAFWRRSQHGAADQPPFRRRGRVRPRAGQMRLGPLAHCRLLDLHNSYSAGAGGSITAMVSTALATAGAVFFAAARVGLA